MNAATFGGFHGIVFDAYGTLFDVSAISDACRHISDEPERFSQLWRAKQLEYSVLRTVMDSYADFGEITSDALNYVTGVFDVALHPHERRRLMQAWLELPPYADVTSSLDQLLDRRQRMVILSNGTRQMLLPMVERAGLTHHFVDVFTSEDVQSFKPDLAIYQLVTQRFYVRMNELLFVTANGFDVAGAKSAGLTVCRVNRQNLPLDPLGHEPDIVVRDLSELVDILLGG